MYLEGLGPDVDICLAAITLGSWFIVLLLF